MVPRDASVVTGYGVVPVLLAWTCTTLIRAWIADGCCARSSASSSLAGDSFSWTSSLLARQRGCSRRTASATPAECVSDRHTIGIPVSFSLLVWFAFTPLLAAILLAVQFRPERSRSHGKC